MKLEPAKIKKIHFVGIKGVAMTALALWAIEAGFQITGSDTDEEFPTNAPLTRAKIKVLSGFSSANVRQKELPNLVVYTGAHGGRDNPEVETAIDLGIPVMAHGQALGAAMAGKRQISVAGSHGKTTTSAMIATILSRAGLDPSYAVGCGEIFGLGASGHYGGGEWFVAEADEYITDPGHDATPRFLWQKPEVLVVTNIDWDHPDVYPSLASVQAAFVKLSRQRTGIKLVLVNTDDPASKPLFDDNPDNIFSYGFSPRADLQIAHIGFGQERTFFTLKQKGVLVGEFSLKVAGRHNALNAVAAASACRAVGLSWEEIRRGLLTFAGTKRRFEKIGTMGSVIVYDDYAHHPREIEATLKAARNWYPQERIIAVFQPHTYSRTKFLLHDFAKAFSAADMVITTDIYPSARETSNLGISGETLAGEVVKYHARAYYAANERKVAELISQKKKEGDVIILMGAGNIYTWGKKIMQNLK